MLPLLKQLRSNRLSELASRESEQHWQTRARMLYGGIVGLCIFAGILTSSARAEQHAYRGGIEPILSAWRERQERVRSLRVTWKEQRYSTAGFGSTEPNVDPELMKKDHQYEMEKVLQLKGNWMRYTFEGTRPVPDGSLGRQESDSAFDGEVSKTLTLRQGDRKYPAGFILPEKGGLGLSIMHTRHRLEGFPSKGMSVPMMAVPFVSKWR